MLSYATLAPVTKDLYITYSRSETISRCHAHESEVKGVKRGSQAVRKEKSVRIAVLLKILRYSSSCLFLATCPVSKNCINSLESLQMQRKRRERWERSDEKSNMALFWSLFTWTSKNTFNLIWLNFNEFCCPKFLFPQHEGAFLAILAAVKGSQAEKRLASQFIARFFKYFPKLQENAIDAMLDLCEDEDNMVSFKTMAHFCPQVSHLTCLFHTFMCN